MRKHLFLPSLALLLALAQPLPAAAPSADNGEPPQLTRIAANVYAYVGGDQEPTGANSYAANAGIVIGNDGVLVVDTLISAKEGRRFLADIRKVTDKPIKYVVNTHYHLDHALGNCVFADLGATLISHAADQTNLRVHGEEILRAAGKMGVPQEDLLDTRLAPPTVSFTDRMKIDLGGVTVELIYPGGPTHSDGSCLVYLPGEKVLFAGDILFVDFHPYLADGEVGGWIKALDFMQTLDLTAIIPGHGRLSTPQDIASMKTYLETFDREARRLVAAAAQTPPLDIKLLALRLENALPPRKYLSWAISSNLKKYLPREEKAGD